MFFSQFFSFSYSGVCFQQIELSFSDVIVFKKVPAENETLRSVGGTNAFIELFHKFLIQALLNYDITKIKLYRSKHTRLYKNEQKIKGKHLMETTV